MLLLFQSSRIFHSSVSWRYFTGVWVTASLLQVSRTIFSSLSDLNNTVAWIVLILPLIANSFYLFSKPLGTVPSLPTTSGTNVTFIIQSFFSSLARSKYLSILSHSFIFILWFARTVKSTRCQVLFFTLIKTRSGRLAEIGWPFVSQSPRKFMNLIFWVDSGFFTYHIVVDQIFIPCTIPSGSPFRFSLVFLWRQFVAFTYYIIKRFPIFYIT